MATSLFGPGIGIGNRNGNRVNPPNWNFVNRPPTVNDNQVAEYTVGDFWMDMSASPDPVMWVLVSLEGNSMSIGAQATWVEVTTGGGTLLNTLTGDDAIPVTPLANNIDILAQATAGATVGFSGAVPHQLHLGVTDAGDNTTIGLDAGNVAMTATNCTAVGFGAMQNLTSAAACTAIGSKALNALTSGLADCALGGSALLNLTTGNANVAIGNSAQVSNVTGGTNVSIGNASLQNLVSGNQNFSAGHFAGSAFTTNESNNIMIGNAGVVSDNNTTRIGAAAPGTGQIPISKTFIYGVDGVNVGSTANVVTEVGNQLGTAVITAGAGITITPTANTITISSGGVDAQSFVTDAGTAIPVAGVLNIIGGTAITTSGSGNTVTITNTGSGSAAGTLSFKGSLPAAAAIAGGGTPSYLGATVAMQTIYDNSGGAWNPGNGAGTRASFTAPATGIYVFTLYYDLISLNSNNTQMNQFILAPGGLIYNINAFNIFAMSFNTGATQEAAVSGTIQLNLTSGDLVNFGCTLVGSAAQWSGNNALTQLYTSVSGYRLA